MPQMTKKKKGNATINDVARLAGVSKRTVSRVINQSASVNQATRKKILDVIAELDYSPSRQARGLASSRSYLLGLIYDDPNGYFIHSIQKGILSVCFRQGYELVVHPAKHSSPSLVDDVLDFINKARLDGVIILSPISTNDDLAKALREHGINYVRLAARKVDDVEHVVVSNDRLAMSQVADLFVAQGHQHIGLITGPLDRLATTERLTGLQDQLVKLGASLNELLVVNGDFSFESGKRCAEKLLKGKPRPTAIFASNDEMGIGAISMAIELDMKVPKDLVVVGYDDGPMAARFIPSLTTLRRPNETMAELAAQKLIAQINGDEELCQSITTTVIPELILRESSALKA